MRTYGEYKFGIECPACGFLQLAFASRQNDPAVCRDCGALRPAWAEVAIRWVRVHARWYRNEPDSYYQKKPVDCPICADAVLTGKKITRENVPPSCYARLAKLGLV